MKIQQKTAEIKRNLTSGNFYLRYVKLKKEVSNVKSNGKVTR